MDRGSFMINQEIIAGVSLISEIGSSVSNIGCKFDAGMFLEEDHEEVFNILRRIADLSAKKLDPENAADRERISFDQLDNYRKDFEEILEERKAAKKFVDEMLD
jgi:hypothetical protein